MISSLKGLKTIILQMSGYCKVMEVCDLPEFLMLLDLILKILTPVSISK